MEIIHVLSRGVDKRKIFLDDQDRFRFIHDLFEFNDIKPVNTSFYIFNKKYNDVGRRNINFAMENKEPRKLLVKILAFCIMPNHYHILLMPLSENNAPLFMKKLNGGYAKYFNNKYKRKGTLFESKYKSIIVKNEAHFIHLPYYIHFNPLDIKFPEWRSRELKNYKEVMKFLENYRWSSHLDYLGKKNFPSVTQRDFLLEFFGGTEGYKKDIIQWVKDIDMEDLKDFTLEQ